METFIAYVLYDCSYLGLFSISFGYFMLLYFGLGPLFLYVCKVLERKNLLSKINPKPVSRGQIIFEIKHSTKSIFVFGCSILPIIYLIRKEHIDLLPNSTLNIIIGIVMLTLWNEIHFYCIHRVLHHRYLMRRIHYIHHRSVVPTVYAVYSFHWVEALLLSTVPLTLVPFVSFSIVAVFLYPIVSILLNFAGHCNYRFGHGQGEAWKLLGTHHNKHHLKGHKNYGFALYLLDRLFSRQQH